MAPTRESFIRYIYVILGVVAFAATCLAIEAIITDSCHWHYVWEHYTSDTQPNPADYCG
ncbi:uncharacterized protein METZ01_LOCUS226931 [marine metagenome]|uniref:Uncharacterized protein n=1 Tax=marine metagenome TaxID=408172 RepID=A0A382GHF9_9ZZZZ